MLKGGAFHNEKTENSFQRLQGNSRWHRHFSCRHPEKRDQWTSRSSLHTEDDGHHCRKRKIQDEWPAMVEGGGVEKREAFKRSRKFMVPRENASQRTPNGTCTAPSTQTRREIHEVWRKANAHEHFQRTVGRPLNAFAQVKCKHLTQNPHTLTYCTWMFYLKAAFWFK